jgi:hypothetical protein
MGRLLIETSREIRVPPTCLDLEVEEWGTLPYG